MFTNFESPFAHLELTELLDELSAGCDPDFDAGYEELEREFAERRLHFSTQA